VINLAVHTCHPIFPFDYFFGAAQSTTPESVISDYRHNKRTDSSFDHNNIVKNATEAMEMREEEEQQQQQHYKENNAEFYAGVIGKLIGSVRSSFVNLFDDVKKRNQHFREKSQRVEAQKKKAEELNNSISVIMQHLSRNRTVSADENSEKIAMEAQKRKRNDRFMDDDDDKVGERDEISEKFNTLDTDYFNEDYATTAVNDFEFITPQSDNSWYSKYYEYYNAIKQQHSSKKARKIQTFLKLVLTPVLLLNETTNRGLTLDIIHDNHTIAQLTPLEVVRILHRDSHDRFQLRMKRILKRIVYKYTRLYLIARRNFKRTNGGHHAAQSDDLKILNSISEHENDISDDEEDLIDDDFEFTTSDGRKSVKSVESLAILLLEIFGALYALGIGFWAHLENGFFFELLD
jgi:hypothetical protein